MTQVNSAQPGRRQLALRPRATDRSLAQRRADFQAQMREMALSDLKALADRLHELHHRLEREEGRSFTQQEVATAAKIPYRTYQAWIGAHNENRDGKGYDALAKFYRRKLRDKTITRNWIVFGDEALAAEPVGETQPGGSTMSIERLDAIEDKVEANTTALEAIMAHLGISDEEDPLAGPPGGGPLGSGPEDEPPIPPTDPPTGARGRSSRRRPS